MGRNRTERVELTTLVMVTDTEGRILVQDRLDPDWKGLCFPGGHVEPEESFVRAAVREVYEETGLTVESPRLCGIKQFPINGGRYMVLFFRADRYTGTLRSSEEGPVFWVFPEALDQYELTDHFMEALAIFNNPELTEFFWYWENDDWKFEIL